MLDPYYLDEYGVLYCGDVCDVLSALDDASVQCCLTSPPYWVLRDYGIGGQIGFERTIEEYVDHLVGVSREIKRVMKKDGTFWLNLGDSYASDTKGSGGKSRKQHSNAGSRYAARHFTHGLKPKDLCGIPWRVALAFQADGWWLRQDIIWAKPNPMPESVRDRCTKAHEYVFLLTKSSRYYYDQDVIKEPSIYPNDDRLSRANTGDHKRVPTVDVAGIRTGRKGTYPNRNKRSVWTVSTQPYKKAHFATFPPKLIEPMILAGSRPGDMVLDSFIGSGTTAMVAKRLGRRYVGIDLKEDYLDMAIERIRSV